MRLLLLLLLLVPAGCGAESLELPPGELTAEYDSRASGEAQPAETSKVDSDSSTITDAPVTRRKIIYTAEINLVVENFDPIPGKIEEIVLQFDAYIARSYFSGSPGERRSGTWTVRVPVSSYHAFVAAIRNLGELQSVRSDSKDVTAEFFDVDARIRNKQREEERLIDLLGNATGKLQDILEVERELSRVRGEIEQLQGRMRVLEDLTAMTTVELRIQEIVDFVPPPSEAPSYVTRVRRAFTGSIDKLVLTVQAISIGLAAVLPWLMGLLLLAATIAFPCRIYCRWRRS